MKTEFKNPVGVVLAGGLSTRMGRDKALLPWGEGTLLDHMIGLLETSGLGSVVVCGERPGYPSFPDSEPNAGPGVAVSHFLASLEPDAWALIVPVDMPLLTQRLIHALLGAPDEAPRAACYADHPLPALLPARDASGRPLQGHSLRALHRAAGSLELPIEAGDQAAFLNVNTPENWDRARRKDAA